MIGTGSAQLPLEDSGKPLNYTYLSTLKSTSHIKIINAKETWMTITPWAKYDMIL